MEYQPAHSLLGCPVEVCQSIFSYLSRSDLVNLCLVHANLRILAEPFLYAKIQLTWEQDPRRRELQPHPITSLLRSILRRPQLATYVREVSLVGCYTHYSSLNLGPLKILISEHELDEPRTFVAKTTVPYRETWLDGLRNGIMDAYVAVLLSQPLRLTSLSIIRDFLCESRFIGLVFRSLIFEPNAYDSGLRLDLRHLETVSLETTCDHFRFYNNARNTADILPIFYIPSIKRLSATIDTPTAFTWPATHPPSPSRLQRLKLDNLREHFLGQLLSATHQLQYLDWTWYYFEEAYDRQFCTRILDLTQITEAISYVRESLTELVISALNMDDPIPAELTIQGSMRGMCEFQKVTKLTVPFIFLVGVWSADLTRRIENCLPPSLESLTITEDLGSNDEYEWWDDDSFAVLELWLKTYHVSTPHLRDVNLLFHYTHENVVRAQRLSELTNGVVRVQLQKVQLPSTSGKFNSQSSGWGT